MKIEKNVPIPERNSNKKKYPFGEMEIGDSVFEVKPTGIYRAAGAYGRRHGMQFRLKTENNGERVWRIK